MTDKYTPEKVAELIAGAERAWEAAGHIPQGTMVHETQWLPFANLYSVAESLLDALTAVSAERDAAQRKARMIPKRLRADRDRLHEAITEARKLNDRAQRDPDIWEDMERILRAALDKEGNDDE